MKALLWIGLGAAIGVTGALGWFVWYFRDVMK
jgi:hypothetical protein